ncbi:MAG TPA: hypothetical protein VGY56_10735 [Verrucomicrobiae bacterium]|nr:hypothetical protein [Verrucomicrobiae bacterium]
MKKLFFFIGLIGLIGRIALADSQLGLTYGQASRQIASTGLVFTATVTFTDGVIQTTNVIWPPQNVPVWPNVLQVNSNGVAWRVYSNWNGSAWSFVSLPALAGDGAGITNLPDFQLSPTPPSAGPYTRIITANGSSSKVAIDQSSGVRFYDSAGNLQMSVTPNGVSGPNIQAATSTNASLATNAVLATNAIQLVPHLGFVGNNTRMDSAVISGNKEWMQRTPCIALAPITIAAVVLQNMYDPGTGIVGPGGNQYATLTFEYPSNTFTRFTFGGLTNGIVPNGSWLMSDFTNVAVAVPRGATFWVREWASNGLGGICYDGPPYANNNYNYCTFGATVTDVTGGPGVGAMGASQYWNPPLAIIGPTTEPSVLMLGDSRVEGQGDSGAVSGDLSMSAGQSRLIDEDSYCEANMGIASMTWAVWMQNDKSLLYFTNFATAVYMELGINDWFVSGQSAFYTETNYSFFATNCVPTLPLYSCTMEPRTTSIDNFTTLNGQLINSGADANRVSFNQAQRNRLINGIVNYLELAGCVESSSNSGLWAVNGYPGWLSGDGTHCSTAGQKLEAASIEDFFRGSTINFSLQNGFMGGPVQLNGNLLIYNGSLTMRSNTFSVFILTNGLNDGDSRLIYSNGPAGTGGWVSCHWFQGPTTNFVGTSGGSKLQ